MATTTKAQAKPSETPKARPTAQTSLGATTIPVWKPSITLANGEAVHCKHTTYGHESEAAAKRCIASMLNQAGAVAA
jgi:hypothetical protein